MGSKRAVLEADSELGAGPSMHDFAARLAQHGALLCLFIAQMHADYQHAVPLTPSPVGSVTCCMFGRAAATQLVDCRRGFHANV